MAELPDASVACHNTTNVPVWRLGKLGDTRVTCGAPQLSVADGAVSIDRVTLALHPELAAITCEAGQVITGAVFSLTSIVKVQLLLLPALSFAT